MPDTLHKEMLSLQSLCDDSNQDFDRNAFPSEKDDEPVKSSVRQASPSATSIPASTAIPLIECASSTSQAQRQKHQCHSRISSTASIFSNCSTAKTPDTIYSVSSSTHSSSLIPTYDSPRPYHQLNDYIHETYKNPNIFPKTTPTKNNPNYMKNITNISCLFLFNDYDTLKSLYSRANQLLFWTEETLLVDIGLSQQIFPTTDYETYVNNILEEKKLSATKVALALHYILKLKEALSISKVVHDDIKGKEKLFFTVALMLACKYFDDAGHKTKDWVSVSGFLLQELNSAERYFLINIDYRLFTSSKKFYSWQNYNLLTWLQIQAVADIKVRVRIESSCNNALKSVFSSPSSTTPPASKPEDKAVTKAARSSLKRNASNISEPDETPPIPKRPKTWAASQIMAPLHNRVWGPIEIERKSIFDNSLQKKSCKIDQITTTAPVLKPTGVPLLEIPLEIQAIHPHKDIQTQVHQTLDPQRSQKPSTKNYLNRGSASSSTLGHCSCGYCEEVCCSRYKVLPESPRLAGDSTQTCVVTTENINKSLSPTLPSSEV